jgi:hypothetical protein
MPVTGGNMAHAASWGRAFSRSFPFSSLPWLPTLGWIVLIMWLSTA